MDSRAVSLHLVRAVGLEYLRALLRSRGISLQHEQQTQQQDTSRKKEKKKKQQQRQSQQQEQQILQQQRLKEKARQRQQRETEEQQVFDALWHHVFPCKQQQQQKKTSARAATAADGGEDFEAPGPGKEQKRGKVAGTVGIVSPGTTSAEGGDSRGSWPVHAKHLCKFLKGCMQVRMRELELLDAICDVLAVLLEAPQTPDIADIVELADACTALRLWRPQLFEVVANCLLQSFRAAAAAKPADVAAAATGSAAEAAAAGAVRRRHSTLKRRPASAAAEEKEEEGDTAAAGTDILEPYQVVVLLEAFSHQKLRHTELLQLLESSCFDRLLLFSPRLCCRVLHALALLRRPPHPPVLFSALMQRIAAANPLAATLAAGDAAAAEKKGEAVAGAAKEAPEAAAAREQAADTSTAQEEAAAGDCKAKEKLLSQKKKNERQTESVAALRLADLAKIAHALFLLEAELQQRDLLLKVCCCMAPLILEHPPTFWRSCAAAVNLHQQLLLLHSALRYINRDRLYEQLQPNVRNAFRRLQRIELKRNPRPPTNFVVRMSELLTKLRIAHFCYATRGPLVFDVLERDRRLIWQCNTADRFYARSADKTTSVRLQERIAKGMGLRVASCEYWQWQKMKRRRTRLEYLRMQRYYALKDRRQFDEEFEGWMLPLVHHMHRRCRLHYPHYFPNYVPLSRVEY